MQRLPAWTARLAAACRLARSGVACPGTPLIPFLVQHSIGS